VGRHHAPGAVQVPDRRGDARRHDRRRSPRDRAAAEVPLEVREARRRSAARALPGSRGRLRRRRGGRFGPVKRLALIATAALALAAFAASSASAASSDFQLVRVNKGVTFPTQKYVLSLKSVQPLTNSNVKVTENGGGVLNQTLV